MTVYELIQKAAQLDAKIGVEVQQGEGDEKFRLPIRRVEVWHPVRPDDEVTGGLLLVVTDSVEPPQGTRSKETQ